MPMTGAELLQLTIAEAREDVRRRRADWREMALDFYEGDQARKDEYFKRYGFNDRKALPLPAEDLTKRVIDRISMVYKKRPARSLEGNPEKDPVQKFVADNPGHAFAMQTGERMHNLLDNVLTRFEYDPERERWFFYTETEYIPHFTENNALYPVAYSIPLYMEKEKRWSKGDRTYLFLSADEIYLHDEFGEVRPARGFEDGKNPLGIIPVIDWSSYPIDDYWGMGAKPLVDANQIAIIMQLNIWYALHHQAFDQPYATGAHAEDNKNVKVGTDEMLFIPDGLNVGLLGFNPKLIESTEALERYINRVLSHYGLTASFSDAGDVVSGVALKIKNMDLLEKREHDVEHYRVLEQQAWRIVGSISKYYNLRDYLIPEDKPVHVDFAEIKFPMEPDKEDAMWENRYKHNLATPVDRMVAENPDLTEEKAIEELQKNREFNNTNSSRAVGLLNRIANGEPRNDNPLTEA